MLTTLEKNKQFPAKKGKEKETTEQEAIERMGE